MVFSSTLFIFCFFSIVLLLYLAAYKLNIGLSNIVLLLASMFFYAWGGLLYFFILICIVAVNYFLALAMERCGNGRGRTVWFGIALLIDIGNLFYFKYFNFFLENVQRFGSLLNHSVWQTVHTVALPIGISFYTFQVISYLADVYTRKVALQKNPIKFALYVMMFPQLIAGPIVRYKDVNQEISSRSISANDIETGIKRFIVGFFKKVFIANTMGSMADTIFAMGGTVNTVYAWLGAICYTLQIYYDFSAYSDMAIGIGRMLGFHFRENFDFPYRSQSIQEFWRRWHISLSSWFRDYIYIPLGGSRKGTLRTYFNLFIVFLLTGIWHGAAWQFIVWGLYHGAFLVVERLGLQKVLRKAPRLFRHIYTMVIVIIGWVFFRADNLPSAVEYLKNMFSFNFSNFKNYAIVEQFTSLFWVGLVLAIVFAVTRLDIGKVTKTLNRPLLIRLRYLALWILSVFYLAGISYNPFIYFKF